MLKNTMTLKEMIDIRPDVEQLQELGEGISGLMRLVIVAADKQSAYDFLRHMMNPPYRTLCLNSFKDCLNAMHFDFDGTHAPRPAFILVGEYQTVCDEESLQALMEAVIESRPQLQVEVIADCFLRRGDGRSQLRIYTHEDQVHSAHLA